MRREILQGCVAASITLTVGARDCGLRSTRQEEMMLTHWFKISKVLLSGALLTVLGSLAGCSADAGGDQDGAIIDSVGQALCTVAPFTSGLVATASSTEPGANPATPASAAIDGNASTRWSSAFSDPQWIRVDLGQSRYVDNVVLTWEAASAADYTLEISPDGNAWSTAKTVTAAAAGPRTDTLTGLSAHVGRYVRVSGTRRNTAWGYSIYEFKVNGDANPNCGSAGPVCGDATCNGTETCSSCAADCGACPTGRNISSNLEAEANDGMFGLQFETTTDTGGGQNAGWIAANDYVEWSINVPTAGNYTVTTRSATTAAASLQVSVDGALKSTLNLTSTGGWQNWANFVTPAIALSAGTHTLRVTFTSASQNLNYVKVSAAAAVPDKVTLSVSNVDDYLYVFVNGVRRKTYGIGQGDTDTDVTSWFGGGNNTVRVQNIDTGAPNKFTLQLKVNGALAINEACDSNAAWCGGSLPFGTGIVFDKTYTVNTPSLPARQNLTVTGGAGGKLYINDQYLGLTVPATLSLPQGAYTVGVGTSNETIGAHTGQFFERSVTLGASAQTVNMGTLTALTPNHNRYAILPIRTAIHGAGGPNGTGVLINSDITNMNLSAIATRDQYLTPFSYGLTTWDITILPTVETTPLYINDPGQPADTNRLLVDAGLTALQSQYDTIIFLYSIYKSDGNLVLNSPCCFWGGGQGIAFMNSFARFADNSPNYYLLHEALHTYDSYQSQILRKYYGADGTHGSDEHGYPNGGDGEPDFVSFYRDLERGQVSELNTMRTGVTYNGTHPSFADLWLGDFDVMRHGINWQGGVQLKSLLATSSGFEPVRETALTCGLRAPQPQSHR